MLFLDQLVARAPGKIGEDQLRDPPTRGQLKKKLPMALAVAGESRRGRSCPVCAHRLGQALGKHIVLFCAFLGDDRFCNGAGARRVAA